MLEIKENSRDVFVSKCGRVFKESRYLTRGNPRRRYQFVIINYKRFDVHRLVAETFLDNPESKPWVLHYDDNSLNNNLEDLRWGTAKENSLDAHRNGCFDKTKEKYRGRNIKIVEMAKNGIRQREIAAAIGLTEFRISQILKKYLG